MTMKTHAEAQRRREDRKTTKTQKTLSTNFSLSDLRALVFQSAFAPLRLCVSMLLLLLSGCNDTAPAAAPAAGNLAYVANKDGSDWPIFLGPNQDSRSRETGIITKWPEEGLALVWQKKLGTSYGAPTIANGKLMQFDRFGDKSRLYCLEAATGKELWRHEFPTEYQDLYQYNNGPGARR